MVIKLYFSENKKIMCKIGEKEEPAGGLALGLMLGNADDLKKVLGETKPEIEIEGTDPDLVQTKVQLDEMLNALYK